MLTTPPGDAELDLSVVMPAHNEAGVIQHQLAALAEQHWINGEWEVVVVDNQSSDSTPDIVRAFQSRDCRLRLVNAYHERGINYARNIGIQESRGRSFALCDADDIVGEGWIAAMGDALRSHEFVTGPLELDRLNPRWLADSRGRGDERGLPTFHGLFPTAHGNNMGMQRDVWDRLGRFDEDVDIGADDIEFSMRAEAEQICLSFVPDAVVHYRYRSTPGELWRQGRAYGRARPLVVKRLAERGLPTPPCFAGWRSWLWLLAHMVDLRDKAGRAVWCWVAGNRFGHLEGSVRYRTIFI